MTREDLQQWHNDWENKQVSGDAYALFLNTYINILELRTCKSCKHFELDRFEVGRGTCRNKNTPIINFMVDYDYGCNRYEPKENK